MAFFIQVCLLAFCAFAVHGFTWKNCDSSTPVQIQSVYLSPNPLRLHQGTKIVFGGEFEVRGDAGLHYKANWKIQKKIGSSFYPVWIPVPCYNNFGSCTYRDFSCSGMWMKFNEPAQCPLPRGAFHFPNATFTVPDVPLGASFQTSGVYWARGQLIDIQNNEVMACVEIDIEIH